MEQNGAVELIFRGRREQKNGMAHLFIYKKKYHHSESGLYQRDEGPREYSSTQVPMSPRESSLAGGCDHRKKTEDIEMEMSPLSATAGLHHEPCARCDNDAATWRLRGSRAWRCAPIHE